MSRYEADMVIETLRPGEDGYDTSARGFFADSRPAVVLLPRSPDEIAAALLHAFQEGLGISVRSAGHGPLDRPAEPGTMLIDLRHLNDVEIVDHRRRIVRVASGATWGKVAARLDPHGLALTAGDSRGVGVGGLTLGGGIGWMVRRYGLTIDNLIGARVMTADGELLTVSEHDHAELFWALRGGGGNFGIVVDFDFIAQPVQHVRFGTVAYELDDPAELVARWRDAMRAAPDNLSSTLALTPSLPGTAASAVVMLCYAGQDDETGADADAAIEPLLRLGIETGSAIAERRYSEILEDAQRPPHRRLISRNALVKTVDDALISAITRLQAGPAPTAVALRSLGGAFARVPANATAFAHRDAEAMVIALLMLPETAGAAELDAALRPWRAVAAPGIGTYINFQGSATAADLAAAYPPATLGRLIAVKRAYDPANRFAPSHNIDVGSQHGQTED
jgi:FAD/FMN-containing dehydrogenase